MVLTFTMMMVGRPTSAQTRLQDREAQSALLFELSANVATRTSPEFPRARCARSLAMGTEV
eukprot:3822747-Alexandrium_andersonii.AAC.1